MPEKVWDRHTTQAADQLADAVEDFLESPNWIERRAREARLRACVATFRLSRISRLSRVDL